MKQGSHKAFDFFHRLRYRFYYKYHIYQERKGLRLLLEQIFLLAIIQGLTEFLPISSSGHLILLPQFMGWKDQGLVMDVAVHVGTLGAVLFYFWREVIQLTIGFFNLATGRFTKQARFFLNLSLATVPAVILGSLISYFGLELRSIGLVASTSIFFGILMYIIDQRSPQINTFKEMTLGRGFLVGCAQALALIPGTSRSGACMTMGRLLGFERRDAARFSFLLSMPAIIAAATHTGIKVVQSGESLITHELLIGIGVSLMSGLVAIHFMMRWLQKSSLTPFVIYRLFLGGALLLWIAFA